MLSPEAFISSDLDDLEPTQTMLQILSYRSLVSNVAKAKLSTHAPSGDANDPLSLCISGEKMRCDDKLCLRFTLDCNFFFPAVSSIIYA